MVRMSHASTGDLLALAAISNVAGGGGGSTGGGVQGSQSSGSINASPRGMLGASAQSSRGMNLGPSKVGDRWNNQKAIGGTDTTAKSTASTSTTTTGNSNNSNPAQSIPSAMNNGWMGVGTPPAGHQLHGPVHGPKGLLRQSWSPHSASNTPRSNPSLPSPSSSTSLAAGQSDAALRGT